MTNKHPDRKIQYDSALDAAPLTRRDLLKFATGSAVFGISLARAARAAGEADTYTIFSPEQARFMEALADGIIPPDDDWPGNGYPGGRDAGCVSYIDTQLAGAFGQAAGWYMAGPHQEGETTQGYQLALTPVQLYTKAIDALMARDASSDTSFETLSEEERERYLQELEAGVDLDGLSSKEFFEQLVANIKEGFFADPSHGGNKDMVGWRMVGFPGARGQWRELITVYDYDHQEPPIAIGAPGHTHQKTRG